LCKSLTRRVDKRDMINRGIISVKAGVYESVYIFVHRYQPTLPLPVDICAGIANVQEFTTLFIYFWTKYVGNSCVIEVRAIFKE
jgi:hypothetical protein